jgi:MoxR-like ATPase
VTPLTDFADRLIRNIETVIVGKRQQIEMLLVALLCQGHVLIEDVPGTGKTMLARAAAASLGLQFKRVQCTPDLLPNDITGVSVFNQQTQSFDFRPGPVFVNILLADEINRATPREYERTLATHLPEAQAETDQLTQAFVEARYSRQAIGEDQARRVRAYWEQVRAALQARRRGR